MNLFDRLLETVLREHPHFASLQAVVEKELLHHEILFAMGQKGFFRDLTFIGGTCLRLCHGSKRLSEDLDFTGGKHFSKSSMQELGQEISDHIAGKYGLSVIVDEPRRESGNTDTWRIKVITRPQSPHLPVQRIHIDICSIESHTRLPVLLRNQYGVDMGTAGLIVYAQTKEEILADKWIALAGRPNRIKQRDVWDIAWLVQNGVQLDSGLLMDKLVDRQYTLQEFCRVLRERLADMDQQAFLFEMQRFLDPAAVKATIMRQEYFAAVKELLRNEMENICI